MNTKHLLRLLTLVVITLITAICFVTFIVELRGRDLALRTPMALENLDKLGERLNPGIPQVDDAGVDEPMPVEDIKTNQSTEINFETLPTRLERRLSFEEITRLRGTIGQKRRLELLFRSTAIRIDDSVSFVLGKEPLNGIHTSSALAQDMMDLRDWESAKQYLLEAVKVYETEDPTRCKIYLGLLAWLEEDLEKAGKLLELSCQGEFRLPYPPYEDRPEIAASQLWNAYRICKETESRVLADHYLTRLWEEYPKFAEQFGVEKAPVKS